MYVDYFNKLGFFTFPIKKNTKIPDVPKGYMEARYNGKTGDLQIKDNYGIIVGKDRAVIDFDKVGLINEFTENLDKLKKNTPICESGRGNHVFIRCPGIERGIKAKRDTDGAEIDIKGPRSYVVGAGSYYIPTDKDEGKYSKEKSKGFEYKLLSQPDNLMTIPFDALLGTLRMLGFTVDGGRTVKEIGRQGISKGSRNEDLFKLLATLRGKFDFNDDMIDVAAKTFNQFKIKPQLSDHEIDTIINSVNTRIPIGGDKLKTKRQRYSRR